MQNFDISTPRRRYYSDECTLPYCPECKALMVEQQCTIVLWVKSKTDETEFITSLEGSFFCEKCPVVVFDTEIVEKAAIVGIMDDSDFQYNIFGFVNLDLIPEEKKHLELGCDENPISLVEFLPELNTKTIISESKPERNDSCSCGSGLKYKKCCGKQ